MAEIGPTPEFQPPPPATQPAPEGATGAMAIIESQKPADNPRETLTKIARLKQFGTYGIMGLMVLGMLSQVLSPMMQESEGRSGH